MFSKKQTNRSHTSSFMALLRRMRGNIVTGPDGEEGVWLYFDESEDDAAHYGYDNYSTSSGDYYLQ